MGRVFQVCNDWQVADLSNRDSSEPVVIFSEDVINEEAVASVPAVSNMVCGSDDLHALDNVLDLQDPQLHEAGLFQGYDMITLAAW